MWMNPVPAWHFFNTSQIMPIPDLEEMEPIFPLQPWGHCWFSPLAAPAPHTWDPTIFLGQEFSAPAWTNIPRAPWNTESCSCCSSQKLILKYSLQTHISNQHENICCNNFNIPPVNYFISFIGLINLWIFSPSDFCTDQRQGQRRDVCHLGARNCLGRMPYCA